MYLKNALVALLAIVMTVSGLAAAQQPKISILTSVFNGDEFIEGFMQDITRQTIFDQCELIIVNAASPGLHEDEVIFRYMKQFTNIVYVKLAVDPGLYGVWNLAIRMSRGEYLTNANIDDRLAPESLALHAHALDNNPSVGIVYSPFYIGHTPNQVFESATGQKVFWLPEGNRNFEYKAGNHPMWRKALHTQCGYFDETYKGLADWDMWIRFALAGVTFMKLPQITGVWYHNPTGISTDPTHGFIATEFRQILQKYRSFFARRVT